MEGFLKSFGSSWGRDQPSKPKPFKPLSELARAHQADALLVQPRINVEETPRPVEPPGEDEEDPIVTSEQRRPHWKDDEQDHKSAREAEGLTMIEGAGVISSSPTRRPPIKTGQLEFLSYRGSNKSGSDKSALATSTMSRRQLSKPASPAPGIDDEASDDEDLPDLETVYQKKKVAEERAEVKRKQEESRRRLFERKMELAAQQRAMEYQKPQDDSDDDLLILDEPSTSYTTRPAKPPLKSRPTYKASANAINNRIDRPDRTLRPDERLAMMSGKAIRSRDASAGNVGVEGATESMLQHAGRQYAHADMRMSNGRAIPHGLEYRKTEPITDQERDSTLLRQAKAKAAEERRKKERESGLAARRLEEKQSLELSKLAEAAAQHNRGWEVEERVSDGDDDSDQDYRPEKEEKGSEQGNNEEGQTSETEGDKTITYSGEEEEDEMPPLRQTHYLPESESSAPTDGLHDNAEEDEILHKRTAKKHRKAAFVDSDDEQEALQIAPGVAQSSTNQPKSEDMLDGLDFGADFDGGDGDGFGGFFGATQAPEQSEVSSAVASFRVDAFLVLMS